MGDIVPPSSLPSTGIITHIVLFKYRSSITWTDLQSHFNAFLALPQKCLKPALTGKQYMLSMKAGKNMSWEKFSKGMTHGFVLDFRGQDDLDFYLTEDPVHLAFSKEAEPMIEDSVVVDVHHGILFGSSPVAPTHSKTYTGSCHCGQISWTAKLDKAEHVLCHCNTCKKLGGGPYSLNAIISREDLNILNGSQHVKTYTYTGASGKSVNCHYCSNCTSHVYHHQEIMGSQVIVRTILLDGGGDMRPAAEIFGEGRLSWVRDLEGVLS